ncbi:hypothetical protein PAHAL_9G016800 [Panicum hallii]|uniref:Uncharacterized protein n=1 Tax=Panicum hallii TaxID=206008 RepID=A0A2T8HZS7_9POAL|nr:hypothetical protein PAHAL_9G016800 [Panicum hallii]
MDCISVSWPGSPVCLQVGFPPPPRLPPGAGRLGLVFILRWGAAPLEHRRQAGAGSCASTERLWGGGGVPPLLCI